VQDRVDLDVTLSTSSVDASLQPSTRFWYAFDRGVGWEVPFAETVRRTLPGAPRRARRRVLNDLADVVDRQIGRARADLQARLHDSVRVTLGQLDRQHQQILHSIRAALADARELHAIDHVGRERRRAELTSRLEQLRSVRADLGEA
jgi:hypothetical protein